MKAAICDVCGKMIKVNMIPAYDEIHRIEDENGGFVDNYDICNNCMTAIKKFCKELYGNERSRNERLY